MISVKEAYEIAAGYTREHCGAFTNFRLEEVSSGGNDDASWLITLSMVIAQGGERHYKLYRIRKDTGEVVAMKIRDLP